MAELRRRRLWFWLRFPGVRNFFVSHQWLRELNRRNAGPIVGVDSENVWIGHYGQCHRSMSDAAAVAEFSIAEDARGWEIIVPRRIHSTEIHRIRVLPQIIGWRYFPNAKGKKPYCTCRFCTRGDYGARKLRKRLGAPDA